MYKTLIVDDELLARKSLERLCSMSEDIDLLESCADSSQALEVIENNSVDLLFLDIKMPGISGLELLDQIPYNPQVVFCTSDTSYAYDAYEYNVTDFLRKPIRKSRFKESLEKVKARSQRILNLAETSGKKEIYIKYQGKLVRIDYESILYIENAGDYLKVITDKGNFIVHGTLKGISCNINHPRFVRVHRSFIANLGKVDTIEDNNLCIQGNLIPISRAHKGTLLNLLNIHHKK